MRLGDEKMGVIAVRYLNAENIDAETKAKNSISNTGIIKMVISNPDFSVSYTKVDSAFDDIKKSFEGKTKNINLADLSI